MTFAGKTMFISGASRGIGLAIALRAARDGANVAIAAKTANSLFAVGFHERFADLGVTANAVMPGGVKTGLQRHMAPEDLAARGWDDDRPQGWKSPEQGAATSVWAAVAPELDGVGGKYLQDCTIAAPWTRDGDPPNRYYLPYVLDAANADRLWTLSEQLVRPPAPSAGTHQA
jgi:NAD(P)-dependent dehydrogenase (short-subunit alcohol dehydrogenase family)